MKVTAVTEDPAVIKRQGSILYVPYQQATTLEVSADAFTEAVNEALQIGGCRRLHPPEPEAQIVRIATRGLWQRRKSRVTRGPYAGRMPPPKLDQRLGRRYAPSRLADIKYALLSGLYSPLTQAARRVLSNFLMRTELSARKMFTY